MNRQKRKEAQERAEALTRRQAGMLAEAEQRAALREQAFRRALARSKSQARSGRLPLELQASLSREGAELTGELFARLPGATSTPRLGLLLRHAIRVVPRVVSADYMPGLYWLSELDWQRPLEKHEPTGKGRDQLFRGLAAHLLAAYPTPPFLYSAFFEDDAETLSRVVAAVAAGGSLFAQCQSGALPVPLTRRMCHRVMLSPARTRFMTAIRAAQVAVEGGNGALLRAWMVTSPGARLHDVELERFWHGVLGWLARNPVAVSGVAPLVDYVAHRRAGDPDFSLKGRSAVALVRAMTQWHAELAQVRVNELDDRAFRASGLKPGTFDRSKRDATGDFVQEVWQVAEILTNAALAKEGAALKHCVYSYRPAIESGRTSIWSMTLFNGTTWQRAVTIEVRNAERRVVQARGRHNRPIRTNELQTLLAWAGENELSVCL